MPHHEDECPFCGEPIEREASFCKHCFNDAETGWKEDLDYWAVELPEDGDEEAAKPRPEASREQAARLVGPALVTGSWIFFVIYGASNMKPPGLVLFPALYLAAIIVILSRLAPRLIAASRQRARQRDSRREV